MADVGCRNTVFGAQIQSGAKFVKTFRHAGIRSFRLEYVHQSAEQVINSAQAVRDYLAGNGDDFQLDEVFRECCPAGTTDGSLFVPAGFRQLVQLNG
jgi:putative protease